MARYRPSWLPPRTCYPKGPDCPAVMGPLMLSRRSSFGDFSPGTGRRQCVALSKGSGARCRNDAVQGCERCRFHFAKRRTPERALARAFWREKYSIVET